MSCTVLWSQGLVSSGACLIVLQLYSLKTILLQDVVIRLQGTAAADGVCLDDSDALQEQDNGKLSIFLGF